MKKYILFLFLVGFLLAPAFSFAQVGDVDPNPVGDCVNLQNNLRYRDRDANKNGEVSTLQDFLQSKKYLDSEPTGYFGILTLKAVKNFQKENDINPTGYVGAVTRAKIKTLTCDDMRVENSTIEIFNKQPGAIKSITAQSSNQWVLAIDLLSHNPKWIPGVDSTGGFFINQNTKIRNLTVSTNTKAYDCGVQYADGTVIGPRLQNTSSFISNIQNTINKAKTDLGLIGEFGYTAYFDINGTNITAIYMQCLP